MSVFGDLYGIEKRAQELDPEIRIAYKEKTKKYNVSRNSYNIMEVDALDERVIRALRKGDLQRRSVEDYIRELENSEDAAERSEARAMANKIRSITLENLDRMMDIKHFSLGGI